jgi:phenylacetate-CoA ligase
LQFDLDSGSYERRMAGTFRGYAWASAGPGSRQLYLWGTSPPRQPWAARAKTFLYDRLYNRKILSAFELSDEAAPSFLWELAAWRPEVIVAYTNALYAFARSLKQRALVPPAPRSIVVGAEKLHPFQREFIEAVFRAPVFETYGSREFMLMAAQCERRKALHVTAENLIVEVVDDAGRAVAPGVEGRVVVTDLFNYALPFIRYENGDRAVTGGVCGCGRGLPVLAEVVGRQADMLLTPDGRRLPGLYFPHLLKDFPAVRQFQVLQDRLDEVVLKLVAPSASTGDLDRITAAAQSALGPRVRFSIERVGEIPLTAAGKLLVVVSRVGERGPSS